MYFILIMLLSALFTLASTGAHGQADTPPARYLSPAAPAFAITISQFRESFNQRYPDLALAPFRAIKAADSASLVRAASPITAHLYASAALERGTLKIKSLQITWLNRDPDPLANKIDHLADQTAAAAYMSALIHFFSPDLSPSQSLARLNTLRRQSEQQPYASLSAGAVRYLLINDHSIGLTLAVEPIKLALAPETPGMP